MTSVQIGILGIIVLLVLIMLRIPVGLAMIMVSVLGYIMLSSLGPALAKVGGDLILITENYGLSVIPLFVVMGLFITKAGIAEDLYNAISDVIGNLRGGMAIATMGAAGVFGAVCGSATASASTISSIAIPEMRKHGYDTGFAASVAAVGSTLGILIPPSTTLVLYGVLTEESVGQCLVGGFLPGIMTMFMLMITTYLLVLRKPHLAPMVKERKPISFKRFKTVWPIPAIFLLSIGGIYGGIFTPTEAGAVGAFSSLLVGLLARRFTWQKFWDALSQSARITAMVFIMILGGTMFGYFLTRSLLPRTLTEYISGLDVHPYIIVLIILFIYTAMGFFMDELATLVIMTPIIYPIIISLGYSGVWFGVLTTMMLLSGLLTPPVGVVSLVVAAVTKIPATDVFRYQGYFWITLILAAAIVGAFPQIALLLPNMMY